MAAAAFEGFFAVARISEEILDRGEEKGAKLALPPIGPGVDFVFNEVSEKALREVLRIMRRVAPAADESIKRRPINLAKLTEGSAGDVGARLTFPGREDHAPLGGSERITRPTDGSRKKIHAVGVTKTREKGKPRKSDTKNSEPDFIPAGLVFV